MVGYARRNFLAPIPDVKDFEELNERLIERCDRHSEKVLPERARDKNIRLYFEEEKSKLLSLPPKPFDAAKCFSAKATKYQTVRVDRNWYSIPSSLVGRSVKVRLGCWSICFYDGNVKVAEHPRVFDRGRWTLDPLHYVKLLRRKPGAFEEARPIKEWRARWPRSYETMLERLRAKRGESKGVY